MFTRCIFRQGASGELPGIHTCKDQLIIEGVKPATQQVILFANCRKFNRQYLRCQILEILYADRGDESSKITIAVPGTLSDSVTIDIYNHLVCCWL